MTFTCSTPSFVTPSLGILCSVANHCSIASLTNCTIRAIHQSQLCFRARRRVLLHVSIAWGRHKCENDIEIDARKIYSSSSSSPPSSRFAAAAARLRLTRPGRPPPYGDVRAKSMCFWESRRTTNDGMLTICLPTLNGCSEMRSAEI